MSDASDRGWGRGWPADRSADMVNLTVAGTSFPAGVHRDIAPLMKALLVASISEGWLRLHAGWCWGYANRPIKTPNGGYTTTPSNHSWGLAIDVNAPENPFGGSSHAIPEVMGRFWEQHGFRWGGFYSGTRDWMHFEYMGTPAQVSGYLNELQGREDDVNLELYDDGIKAYTEAFKKKGADPGPPKPGKPEWFKRGWNRARAIARLHD